MNYRGLAISLGVVCVVAVLSGCAESDTSCGTIHNYLDEQTDANGLTLKPSKNMLHSFGQVSAVYAETMACMGMTADGPDVMFMNFRTYYNREVFGPWALYHPGGLVQINTDTDPAHGFTRDCRTEMEGLKHEFVHHILNANELNWHDGSGEDGFVDCGIGVNTYN